MDSERNEDLMENDVALPDDDDDDDGENIISLNKIKASVNLEDDQKSHSDEDFEKPPIDTKAFIPNVKLQSSFQPGSTPSHLLSYFMVQYINQIYVCTLMIFEDKFNFYYVYIDVE